MALNRYSDRRLINVKFPYSENRHDNMTLIVSECLLLTA